MNSYRFAPQARSDLEGIADYIIEQVGADRAEAVVRNIFSAAEKLVEMPEIGHTREDLTEEEVRSWTVFTYQIVYRPETKPLEIVAILSGWRDIAVELRDRFN